MPRHAAVGVDDDLAARQAGVAYGPADHEASGRVDQEVLSQLRLVVHRLGQDRLDNVLPEVLGDQRFRAFGVLCGDQQLLDLDGPAVYVAHAHLGLAVRAQVVERPGAADRREALGEAVCERDRQRHQRVGLVGRVAEHHPLIPGTGDVELVLVVDVRPGLVGLVHSLGDVGGLLVDRVQHRAGVAEKPRSASV